MFLEHEEIDPSILTLFKIFQGLKTQLDLNILFIESVFGLSHNSSNKYTFQKYNDACWWLYKSPWQKKQQRLNDLKWGRWHILE